MPGGFGFGWGFVPWGSSLEAPHAEVSETVTISEGVVALLPLRVAGAVALTAFRLRVDFSQALDPIYLPNSDPTNYTIAGLTVIQVLPGPTLSSVILVTTEQGPVVYEVDVGLARSVSGDDLNPLHDSAVFAGFPLEPTFFATAQSSTKVQLTFSTAMLQNADYTDPASYTVTDLAGVDLPILSVTAVGPSPNRRLFFELGADLAPGSYYVATIVSNLVQTTFNLQVNPPTDLFQWVGQGLRRYSLKISDFSGEVSGGILGEPLGLVFFSPSLEAPAPASAIQVDSVSVCTRAFDVYTPPAPIDPNPLYTFKPGGANGNLGSGTVLFTSFDRLLGAKLNVGLKPSDALDPYTDGPAVAILSERFDPAFVSLLNNSFWTTFDGSGTPFITANNLAPIPPGPTEVITLQGSPESFSLDGFGGDPWGAEDWG